VKKYVITAVIEQDEDGMLLAKVPDLPGCHTQAKTMPKLLSRIKEAVTLCLEVSNVQFHNLVLCPHFPMSPFPHINKP